LIHEIALNARFRTESLGGKLTLHIPNELIEIKTDKLHLTNVISNLVDNAIKYSDKAPIIEISLKKENKRISLSVKDHGIGIKKEYIDKIFDKLYRIPTGNLHNVKGFGLGLSYVKAIAEMEGWNINVKSKLGEWSEFTLIIKE
jgi:two-component system phosphate regulon sensor histidine kinase PhoR